MPEKPFRAIFDTDLTPVRAKDIAAKIRSTAPTTSSDPDEIQGDAVEMSTMQYAEALASFKPLLDYAHELDNKQQREPRGPGRPREHTAFPALLVWIIKPHCRSERATIKELKDTANWKRVEDAAVAAWPDHPALALPQKPTSRGQYRRFAQRILADNPAELENLCSHIRRTASPGSPLPGDARPQRRLPHQTEPSPHRVLRRDVPAQPSAPAAQASASTRTANRSTSSTPTPTTTTPTTKKTPARGATRST